MQQKGKKAEAAFAAKGGKGKSVHLVEKGQWKGEKGRRILEIVGEAVPVDVASTHNQDQIQVVSVFFFF